MQTFQPLQCPMNSFYNCLLTWEVYAYIMIYFKIGLLMASYSFFKKGTAKWWEKTWILGICKDSKQTRYRIAFKIIIRSVPLLILIVYSNVRFSPKRGTLIMQRRRSMYRGAQAFLAKLSKYIFLEKTIVSYVEELHKVFQCKHEQHDDIDE